MPSPTAQSRVSTHRGLKTLSGTNHDLVACHCFTFNGPSNSQYIYIMRTIESLLCATKCPCRSRASSKSIHRAHSKRFNMSSLASTGAPVGDQGQVWRLIQQFQLSRASVGKIIHVDFSNCWNAGFQGSSRAAENQQLSG